MSGREGRIWRRTGPDELSGRTAACDLKPSLAMGVARGAAFCYCGFFIVEYRSMEHVIPNSKVHGALSAPARRAGQDSDDYVIILSG